MRLADQAMEWAAWLLVCGIQWLMVLMVFLLAIGTFAGVFWIMWAMIASAWHALKGGASDEEKNL